MNHPQKTELNKTYDAGSIESYWHDRWFNHGLFSPKAEDSLTDATTRKTPYVIMMPPPNVTGVLHNGHALFVTLQDILIRYHRMLGENALWLPGVDHAGISTQTVVERELLRNEGKTRFDLGRQAFLQRVWQWKEKHGERIVEQLKLMGASADWNRLRFTMDEMCSTAVKEAFVRLWNEGLIYRGERLVNWDPQSQTALSDEEVDHETREGELWRFAYKVHDSNEEIVVATTRPETMLGDTAVAVHPDDPRYHHLIGKKLIHPFFPTRTIKVVTDAMVDREFGTGAVKITPAHDPADFELGERHQLERVNIFSLDAKVNQNGGPYAGLDRFEARKRIKHDLEQLGLSRGSEKIQHAVSISQRSGVDIEPMLSRQYFVSTKPLAEKAYRAVETLETRIIPSNWKKTWDHFMLNIRDWCISRQLWWGHQIPVFYDLIKMKETIEADAKAKNWETASMKLLHKKQPLSQILPTALHELDDKQVRLFSFASQDDLVSKDPDKFVQEEDVLDTWFSAGLWPFATLGWPQDTKDLEAFYPGAVLETGFDILFFWVARMMMFGCHFMGKAPFADIYLHAMVRDAHGRKMSKSLGNAIDPIDVINGITLADLVEKIKTYPVPTKLLPQVLEGVKKDFPDGIPASGADGLRLSLAMLSGQGRDVKLSIPRVSGYTAFLNKIWNATRFALMRIGTEPVLPIEQVKNDLLLEDRWLLSRLHRVIEKVRKCLDSYAFSEASETIYQFFWTEFCDWYIEFAKLKLDLGADPKQKEATRAVLVEVLDASMRLFHPFCPFVSEEIWQKLPTRQTKWEELDVQFCAIAPYPQFDATLVDESAENDIAILQESIVMIRNARQESNLPAQKKMKAILLASDSLVETLLTGFHTQIERLALVSELQIKRRDEFVLPKFAAVNSAVHVDAVLPLEGLLDMETERKRLQKELKRIGNEHDALDSRLKNANFLAKAPPEVVLESKTVVEQLAQKKKRIEEAILRLEE